ncbi:hypothetical protein [Helicobacter sp. MIT 14-3879]|uniref:hypothetical protein n=1 Tax=Helicobacter sp. MIT 14-3879 TaxID=2040649 RepID=UPI000E1F5B26|nr:hypothetical protein [Helicobacter sp. MIT 14-3879]RDU61655.1 hypothetical protein CQA44_08430 [Helicobacter sp. MIT 14-3879]
MRIFDLHLKHIKHLTKSFKASAKLLVVDGAGSLYMDKSHKITLVQTPNFPDKYKLLKFLRTQFYKLSIYKPSYYIFT